MNDVCDTWSSAWAELQKTLAQAPAPNSRMQSSLPGANTWLGRARHPHYLETGAKFGSRACALK